LRTDAAAIALDLPDLVEFILGTGVRIGEALAGRTSAIDLQGRVLEVGATMIREKGKGVRIQDNPKTKAGWRVIALPERTVALAQHRLEKPSVHSTGAIFPSPLAHLRDPSNTTADLRQALDRAGFDWVTSHTFRKTVATWMDEAGMSARQIADHLGHA
jgi:integrase